ncbi:unnamed protein product [Gordionus sp. m RMFG-2023]
MIKLGLPNFTAISQNIQWIPTEDNPADLPSRTWMAPRRHLDLFEGPILEGEILLQQDDESLFGPQSDQATPSLISGLSIQDSDTSTVSYNWDQLSIASQDLA